MRDCEQFLAWALPRLGLDHAAFFRFQKSLCKRVRRRTRELHLADLDAYREYLTEHPEEWGTLDGFSRISISRFFRNRPLFEQLRAEALPWLAREARGEGRRQLRCCCVGVASGEEPYSLRLLWDWYLQEQFPELSLSIVGLDAEPVALERCRCACYRASSLVELSEREIEAGFDQQGDWFCLKPQFHKGISFQLRDVRQGLPSGLFDVLFCRNLVFTYFDRASQLKLLHHAMERLRPGSVFVLGGKESLPVSSEELGLEPSHNHGLLTWQGVTARLVGA